MPAHTNHAVNQRCNCCSCCPGLACWRQMDRHIDYKLQQAGTIDPAPYLRNWRSQAQKICNWGTMILKPRTCACSRKPCGKPTLGSEPVIRTSTGCSNQENLIPLCFDKSDLPLGTMVQTGTNAVVEDVCQHCVQADFSTMIPN